MVNVDTETTPEIQGKSSKIRSSIGSIALFLLMIVVAFGIWCYAEYLEDPIVEKRLVVNFNLTNGEPNEKIYIVHEIASDDFAIEAADQLGKKMLIVYDTASFYCLQSEVDDLMDDIGQIEKDGVWMDHKSIDRSLFMEDGQIQYNKEIVVPITYFYKLGEKTKVKEFSFKIVLTNDEAANQQSEDQN